MEFFYVTGKLFVQLIYFYTAHTDASDYPAIYLAFPSIEDEIQARGRRQSYLNH